MQSVLAIKIKLKTEKSSVVAALLMQYKITIYQMVIKEKQNILKQ
jgi:hypothetical protein